MIVLLVLTLAVLILLGWYFGLRVYGVFTFRGVRPPRVLFWCLLAAGLVALFLTRSPLICTLLYGILFFALGDLLGLALGPESAGGQVLARLWQGGLTPLALALAVTGLAVLNAHSPVLKSYEVETGKLLEGGLSIVMLADAHLGTVVHEDDLESLVARVNGQRPDIVALCGDIFEEGTPDGLRVAAIRAFGGLEATYGVYYVTGNHDSVVPQAEAALWAEAGVCVLDERCVLVDGRFYLAGRADGGHTGAGSRMAATDLLAEADKSLPIILLDHRPGAWSENRAAGADLQLSGHTHAGQLWPFGLFSRLANGINYGHAAREGSSAVVTSGYGVWGFGARTSGRCEYVRVDLSGA